ncbi:MAG TPA: hypothetical protein VH678_13290 [Xanthobacteraceae bacterium]|jgi:hypothetical protein
MSSNDTVQPSSGDTSDWSRAWEAVAKLATARESLQEISRAQPSFELEYPASDSSLRAGKRVPPDAHDQLAGAIAEIEDASAALRRSEPLLEQGLPVSPARVNKRGYWSVWILIGAIWISATFVVATAAAAILYILG